MNSNIIEIGPLVTMPEVNSGVVNFNPLEAPDTVYGNTEPVTLGGVPVQGAKVLIFRQSLGYITGQANSASYILGVAETDASGMWSINVEEFVNFDDTLRYGFYLWYESGELSYSAPILITGAGGAVVVNHEPLEYQEPMDSADIWFNKPIVPVGYNYITSAQKEGGELKEHKFYEKRQGKFKRVFPVERVDTPAEIVSVTIDQSVVSISEGNTVALSATVVANGSPDTSVTWFSADTSVATVVSTGARTATLTPVAPGQVGITARSVFDTSKSNDIVATVTEVAATLDSQAGDEIALQDVYNNTAGVNWFNNADWSSSIDLSAVTPFGVEKEFIGGEWRVTSLILRSNNLVGTLPESLGNLKRCVWLITKDNFLTGQVPVNIYQMTELKYLYLSGSVADPSLSDSGLHPGKTSPETNTFAGSILPPEWGQLPNIDIIELAQSQVEGPLPKEWGQLSTLRKLYLNGSRVEGGWPGGNITGPLPPEWSGMTNIIQLTIGDNRGLTGILPPEWASMPMIHFRLPAHGLNSTIPDEWSAWSPTIRLISIRGASSTGRLTGKVPSWMYDGSAPLLHTTSFSYNNFERIDIDDDALLPGNAINVMSYSYSGVTQGFPNWIKRSRNMQIMSFSGGPMTITGAIDDDFFNNFDTDAGVQRTWRKIRNFRFDGQPLGGTLPSSFGESSSSSSTVSIRLNGCGIGGKIPAKWADFRANGISDFRLYSNNLYGPVPVGIASWIKVDGTGTAWKETTEGLRIDNNNFTYSDLIPLINAWPAVPLNYANQNPFPLDKSDNFIHATNVNGANGFTLNLSGIHIAGNVYQWRRNGVNLSDGGFISGATTNTLVVGTQEANKAGEYTLRITNANAPQLTQSISEPITVNA